MQIRTLVIIGFLSLSHAVLADAPAGTAPAAAPATNWKPDTLSTLSPFGIGGDAHTGRDLPKWMPQMAAIGIHVMRCCNANQRDYLDGLNIQYGGLLYGVPPGDTLDAPGSLPVKDLATWSAFVTSNVKEANGRALYWELWNEPPNFIGPGQTANDYAKLLASTYDAAKAADPHAVVAMCAKSVHINWLDQTIQAGGKDHFDAIILHPYEVLGTAINHAGAEPVYMSIVPTVRKMLAAQDPAKVNVPIIFTELGTDARHGANVPAIALVKAYTMGIAQGVTCIEWFEGMDGDSGPMGLLQANLTPRPTYTAMAQMIKYLGQHPTYLGWVLLNNKDYGFLFQGDKSQILVTWAPKGTKDDIDFGLPVSIVDPLTGTASQASMTTLTEAPIIVDGAPDNLVKLAQANKTKPFPWDGDYTNAKSVSVTYGATNVEKGLHTQSAASIAADVLAYGGSARAGGVPGGNVFMVDPNFLTYTSTPIEVSIVVRRNEANDNAGFKFVYESTTGYKNLGWYTVPDNKEWHTLTYKITDAQFVSMWGYNFSLDSDGNRHNKYDIQSVTVTKLDQ
jgi:hypothetical protein